MNIDAFLLHFFSFVFFFLGGDRWDRYHWSG